MSEENGVYVLDTSAWFTFIEDETGTDIVQGLLEQAGKGEIAILVSFMSFMEVYYITLQERDEHEAQVRLELIGNLPGLRVESTPALSLLAGELKARYRLSAADAWIAALAQERQAILVHKDPEFEQIETLVQMLKLPYKTNA